MFRSEKLFNLSLVKVKMSVTYQSEDCKISLLKKGSTAYQKMSFPLHCGIYSEIDTKQFTFHFNLNNEIIRCKAKCADWGHPHEWLKHTAGDDWVFYSTGGYAGVVDAIGEYYLPNFTYSSNSMLGGMPFEREEISDLVASWYSRLLSLQQNGKGYPEEINTFLSEVVEHSPAFLQSKANTLFGIIGSRISVLPPDARHVDYNLIPLTISRGCLYKCRFCKVKNNTRFHEKSSSEIDQQIAALKSFFGRDIRNQNSIFLGEHDALQARSSLIMSSLEKAFHAFEFDKSYIPEKNIFLFGSVSSLRNCQKSLFQSLQNLSANTYINIGLESADQETLDKIGKPISEKDVSKTFQYMQEINDTFSKIEITCNFIMDNDLPRNHYPKIMHLLRDQQTRKRPKGTVYFSPLIFGKPSRARLFEFNELKIRSRFPTYLYIIQRL